MTVIEEIEAALKVAYENRFESGCGCCADSREIDARVNALETLNQLLPALLEEAKREAQW